LVSLEISFWKTAKVPTIPNYNYIISKSRGLVLKNFENWMKELASVKMSQLGRLC